MANQIITVQLSLPSGVKSPVVTSDKRVTAVNLAKVLRQGLVGGNLGGLSGAGAYFQVQTSVVAASGTATCAAVNAADTVTVNGQALTAAQKRATGTVTCALAMAGDTFSIAGVTFTGVAGAATPGEATFSIDTGNNETAASIVTQVNAYVPLQATVFAKATAAVVTLVAFNQGTSGNSLALASSGATLAVSGAALANGAAVANNAFDMAGTNATTAAALAYAINNSTTAAVQRVTATVADNVVTITAKEAGDAGEAITLASSNGTRLAVSGAALANGSSSAVTRWTF